MSVTFDGGGGSTVCVQANPAVTLSPSNQTVQVGGSTSYTLTVSNKDTSDCTTASFSLSAAMPSGLTFSLASSSLNIAPGSSSSTALQVTSSSGISGGIYNFTVKATNSGTPSYSASASGVATLVASVGVTAKTDKSIYARREPVTMSATVTTDGVPAVGAVVNFTLKNPNNKTYSGNATTDSTGTAVYKYKLKPNDPTGMWGVTAIGKVGSLTGTGGTSFAVQ